jgi:hypothetical protein
VALRINRDRISNRAWGDVDNTALRQRLVQALDNGESGAAEAVREVYAVITGTGPLDQNPSGRWWGPHHEITSDGEVVLNRQGLGAAAAALQGARANPSLSDAERTAAMRHLMRHYTQNDLPLPDGFSGASGEMHVMGGRIYGEMQPADIPLSATFSEADRQALLKGDSDPFEVVIEVEPGKSSRGWHYTEPALQKLVKHVQEKTLSGIKGHQREEDLGTQFVDPATHWIGAMWKDGKAYFRGLVDQTAPDLKRWIRSKRITQPSIFTRPVLSRVNGETHVIDLEPLGIDWAPLDRAGMQSARVVAWGEMDAIGGPPMVGTGQGSGSSGDKIPDNSGGSHKVTSVREAIDALRENGASPSQVIQGMNWRASDVMPVLIGNDRRGVAETLDSSVLSHVAAGEMAKSHKAADLLPAFSLKLEDVGPIVDDAAWKLHATALKAMGEMRSALGLPDTATAEDVAKQVKADHEAIATSARTQLRGQVEKLVAAGEMAIAEIARPAVVEAVMASGEVQPGADDAKIKDAIGKAKALPHLKPIIEARLGTVVIQSRQPVGAGSGASGEMRTTTGEGGEQRVEVGLPVRRRQI